MSGKRKNHIAFDDPLAQQYFDESSFVPLRGCFFEITGNVADALVLDRMLYWYEKKKCKPFYKFLRPCAHKLCSPNDTLSEELCMSAKQIRLSFKRLGPAGMGLLQQRKVGNVTYYDVNKMKVTKLLAKQAGGDNGRETKQSCHKVDPPVAEVPNGHLDTSPDVTEGHLSPPSEVTKGNLLYTKNTRTKNTSEQRVLKNSFFLDKEEEEKKRSTPEGNHISRTIASTPERSDIAAPTLGKAQGSSVKSGIAAADCNGNRRMRNALEDATAACETASSQASLARNGCIVKARTPPDNLQQKVWDDIVQWYPRPLSLSDRENGRRIFDEQWEASQIPWNIAYIIFTQVVDGRNNPEGLFASQLDYSGQPDGTLDRYWIGLKKYLEERKYMEIPIYFIEEIRELYQRVPVSALVNPLVFLLADITSIILPEEWVEVREQVFKGRTILDVEPTYQKDDAFTAEEVSDCVKNIKERMHKERLRNFKDKPPPLELETLSEQLWGSIARNLLRRSDIGNHRLLLECIPLRYRQNDCFVYLHDRMDEMIHSEEKRISEGNEYMFRYWHSSQKLSGEHPGDVLADPHWYYNVGFRYSIAQENGWRDIMDAYAEDAVQPGDYYYMNHLVTLRDYHIFLDNNPGFAEKIAVPRNSPDKSQHAT